MLLARSQNKDNKNELSVVGSNMKELNRGEVDSYSLPVSKMIRFGFVQPCSEIRMCIYLIIHVIHYI